MARLLLTPAEDGGDQERRSRAAQPNSPRRTPVSPAGLTRASVPLFAGAHRGERRHMRSELGQVAQRLIDHGWVRLRPGRDVLELTKQVESVVDSVGACVWIGLKQLLG